MYYKLDGKLIAVGIEQVAKVGIFSRSVYYDPNYKHLNLGTYSALVECFFVRKLNLRFYTLGCFVYS